MTNLTFLLNQYLSSNGRGPCPAQDGGVFTFDAGGGMLLCATELEDGTLEFFASPGYMPADEMSNVASLRIDAADDTEDDDVLERWEASGAAWAIDLDPVSGLVTLTGIPTDTPWDLAGFRTAVEAFREIYRTWEARLQPTPDVHSWRL